MVRSILFLCIVGAAMGAAPPAVGKSLMVDGLKLNLAKKIDFIVPVQVSDVALYEAAVPSTGEKCLVVTGLVVSNLPSLAYDVDLTLCVWRGSGPMDGRCEELTIKIHCPVPKRPQRFFVRGDAGGLNGMVGATHKVRITKFSALDAVKGEGH